MHEPRRAEITLRRRASQGALALLGSPVGVVAACALCLAVWSLAARSGGSLPTAAAQDTQSEQSSVRIDVPIPPSASRRAARDGDTIAFGPRPVPRLRAPFVPNGAPGLEIALQDRDGRSMSHLHAALARAEAGQGQARLLFYGASHTAADIYTGYLRNALQTMFGDAGHGFVLPVQPWRGYHHEGVRIARASADWTALKAGVSQPDEQYFGVAGVAVESDVPNASAFVETPRGEVLGSRVARFDVYYHLQPGGGAFDVYLDGERIERVRTASDRRGGGYLRVPAGEDAPHRLEIKVLGTGPVRIFGVALERDTPGVVVDVHGINGSRARSHLAWNDELYREHLIRRNPDLVALAYGTNESGDDNQPIETYRQQLDQVVGRIRETLPNASCLLIGPSDRPVQAGNDWVDRPRTAQIIETQWSVALAHGCAFFDVVAFQGGSMATVSWASMQPPYAGRDHVHFTRLGYERMGQVLLGAMLEGSSWQPPSLVDFAGEEPTGL